VVEPRCWDRRGLGGWESVNRMAICSYVDIAN